MSTGARRWPRPPARGGAVTNSSWPPGVIVRSICSPAGWRASSRTSTGLPLPDLRWGGRAGSAGRREAVLVVALFEDRERAPRAARRRGVGFLVAPTRSLEASQGRSGDRHRLRRLEWGAYRYGYWIAKRMSGARRGPRRRRVHAKGAPRRRARVGHDEHDDRATWSLSRDLRDDVLDRFAIECAQCGCPYSARASRP